MQEQYNNKYGQLQFDDIFKIKIFEITLRELLLIQSIYAVKTPSEIVIVMFVIISNIVTDTEGLPEACTPT